MPNFLTQQEKIVRGSLDSVNLGVHALWIKHTFCALHILPRWRKCPIPQGRWLQEEQTASSWAWADGGPATRRGWLRTCSPKEHGTVQASWWSLKFEGAAHWIGPQRGGRLIIWDHRNRSLNGVCFHEYTSTRQTPEDLVPNLSVCDLKHPL